MTAICALLGSLLSVMTVQPAVADTRPAEKHSAISSANVVAPDRVLTAANGEFTITCGYSAGYSGETFSGQGVSQAAYSTSLPSNPELCTWRAAGPDGTLYSVGSTGGYPAITAYKNAVQQWVYQLPCGFSAGPGSVTYAPNGGIYLILYGCAKLFGVASTLQPGQTAPSVLANVNLNQGVNYGALGVHSSGVVVQTTSSLRFFDFAGQEAPISHDAVNFVPMGGQDPAVGTDGTVYVPRKATSSEQSACNASGLSKAIEAYKGTLALVKWTQLLPGCGRVNALVPRPGGGVLVQYTSFPSNSPSNRTDQLLAYEANGNLEWEKTFPMTEPGEVYYDSGLLFNVDLGGTVIVQRQRWTYEVQGNKIRPSIALTVYGPAGDERASTLFAGSQSDTFGYRGLSAEPLVAINDGVAYISAAQCMRPCSYSTSKVYAVKVGGLQMDYPRGIYLGKTAQPAQELRYVALGDSYSSGEGVEPFEPGTNVPASESGFNECHRSQYSYGRILDQDMSAGVKLYVSAACSGATTSHVNATHQYPNQPIQAQILNQAVDLVTITIGGNDIGFGPLAAVCVTTLDCTSSSEASATLNALDQELAAKLDATYANLKGRINSSARVIVLGYPQLMPTSSVLQTLPWCGYLSTAERTFGRDVVDNLNLIIKNRAEAAGFTYIDPNAASSPFNSHELCTEGSYFNAVILGLNSEYSFHPNELGQKAYASLVASQLN